MDYLDFDLEIGLGTGRDYPVSVRSPAGQAYSTMRFPFDTLELENALLRLKNALLSSGGVRRKALTESETAVQSFGQKLFEALLVDDLRSLFYESKREVARQGKGGLRLRLHVRAAELAALPWEYLYDPRVPDYLCLSKKTPLVRYLDLTHPAEPLTVALPLRILAMAASPSDQDTLDIVREQERIRRALGPLEAEGLVSLTWLEGKTARDLQRALQRGPWHVFHFTGHGDYDARNGEGVLGLCNEQGKTAYLYATQLARLLADHNPLRLSILNSCSGARGGQQDVFSSTAATLARFGLPAVLAMQEEITDDAATEWTHAFYEALATGLPVDAAVAEARLAITLSVNNSLEWGTPVLFLRAADGVLFHLGEQLPQLESAIVTARAISAPTATEAPSNAPPPAAPQVSPMLPSTLAAANDEAAQEAQQLLGDANYPATTGQLLAHARSKLASRRIITWLETREATAVFTSIAVVLDGYRKYREAPRGEDEEEATTVTSGAPTLQPAPEASPPEMTAEQWWQEGSRLQIWGEHYPEALAAYERALELDPKFARAWYGKGDALNGLKRYEEALAACEQALKLDSRLEFAWTGKGDALNGLKRYEEALAACEQALNLNPTHAGPWIGKGNALNGLQRYKEALAVFGQALRLHPFEVGALCGKGDALHSLKRYKGALSAYEQALDMGRKHAHALCGKGNALHSLKRYEEALSACEQALELDPKYAFAWNGKGNALWSLQRNQEALAAYELALELDPTYAHAWTGKGNVLHSLKRYEEALAAYEKRLQLAAPSSVALQGKGNTLKALGRTAEAEQAYQRARELEQAR